MGSRAAGIALAVFLGLGSGCSESPSEPVLEGAGLRIELPAGTETLEWVRVELWHDNAVSPPGCLLAGPARGALSVYGDPPPDLCTRQSLVIRNLIGETVLAVADTPIVDGSLAWGWDRNDTNGDHVPSGYYPISARCLDSEGEFTFEGHYFVWNSREVGSCEWPLWIREMEPAPVQRVLEFGPFPLNPPAQTITVDTEGNQEALVTFTNPFLVRVKASGMQPFEQEVTLVEGEYISVSVEFIPFGT